MIKRTRVFAWTMILTVLFWTLSPAVGVFAVDRPTITVSTPTNNLVTAIPSVEIQGYVTGGAILDIDNVRVSVSHNGYFTYTKNSLVNGTNSIMLKATNTAGSTSYPLTVIYDPAAVSPSVVVTSHYNGQTVSTPTIDISGSVSNNVYFKYTINNGPDIPRAEVNAPFTLLAVPLNPGDNTIVLTVTKGERVVKHSIHITFSGAGPEITNISPKDWEKVSTGTIDFTGVVTNVSQLAVRVNGVSVGNAIISNGNFLMPTVTLTPGDNTIDFIPDGSVAATRTIHVRYEASPIIVITSPKNNDIVTRDSVFISGKVFNTETDGLTVNDQKISFNSDGTFEELVYLDKVENNIQVKAVNGSLVNTANLTLYYSGIPNIEITSHTSGDTVTTADVIFNGKVFPSDAGTTLFINGDDNSAKISNTDGTYTSKPVTLDPGSNDIEFTLTSPGMGPVPPRTVTRTIKINSNVGPKITVSSPEDGITVYSNTVNVYGQITRADFNVVKVGGTDTKVKSDGSFSRLVTLNGGKNEIKIEAKLGEITTTKTIIVYYDSIAAEDSVVRTKMTDGGEAKAFNDMVKVKLTKGSVGLNTTSVLAVIDPDDCNDIPAQSALIGPLISVGWNGDKPLQTYKITLKYDNVVSDNQAHKVSILHYHVGSEKWTMLSGVVDAKAKTVSVQTDRTGYFAAAIYFKTFDDLTHHWGQRDIEYLVARGAIPLNTTFQFHPDLYITRAEFVMFLVKALGLQPYHQPISSYNDLDHGSDYYDYIEAALRAGLVFGIAHDKFAPNQNLTREEAAAILARAGNMKDLKDPDIIKILSKFTDQESISPWARNQLAAAVKAKVLYGLDDNTFNPQGKTTRAEAAAMLVRLSEILNKTRI